jgi:molybdopterin-guanine dinucleotide biosynthesis protein A
MSPASICFGLLAGGRSSRMGIDKATLHWHGSPLWQHQLRLAAEVNAAEVLIAGKADGPYREAARVIPDDLPDAGPLAGIAALLSAMTSDWLVVAAVDMPLLDAGILRELLALRGENAGVVPSLEGRPEPLAAVYPRTARALAMGRLSLADRSLQSFVEEASSAGLVRVHPWPPAFAAHFRNLNTPREFADAESASIGR